MHGRLFTGPFMDERGLDEAWESNPELRSQMSAQLQDLYLKPADTGGSSHWKTRRSCQTWTLRSDHIIVYVQSK